MKDIMRVV